MLNSCISLWNYYVLTFKAVSKSQWPLSVLERLCVEVWFHRYVDVFIILSLQIWGNCNCYDFNVSAVIYITWITYM